MKSKTKFLKKSAALAMAVMIITMAVPMFGGVGKAEIYGYSFSDGQDCNNANEIVCNKGNNCLKCTSSPEFFSPFKTIWKKIGSCTDKSKTECYNLRNIGSESSTDVLLLVTKTKDSVTDSLVAPLGTNFYKNDKVKIVNQNGDVLWNNHEFDETKRFATVTNLNKDEIGTITDFYVDMTNSIVWYQVVFGNERKGWIHQNNLQCAISETCGGSRAASDAQQQDSPEVNIDNPKIIEIRIPNADVMGRAGSTDIGQMTNKVIYRDRGKFSQIKKINDKEWWYVEFFTKNSDNTFDYQEIYAEGWIPASSAKIISDYDSKVQSQQSQPGAPLSNLIGGSESAACAECYQNPKYKGQYRYCFNRNYGGFGSSGAGYCIKMNEYCSGSVIYISQCATLDKIAARTCENECEKLGFYPTVYKGECRVTDPLTINQYSSVNSPFGTNYYSKYSQYGVPLNNKKLGQPGQYQPCALDETCWCMGFNMQSGVSSLESTFNTLSSGISITSSPTIAGTDCTLGTYWQDKNRLDPAPRKASNQLNCAKITDVTLEATIDPEFVKAGGKVTIKGSVEKISDICEGVTYGCRQVADAGCSTDEGFFTMKLKCNPCTSGFKKLECIGDTKEIEWYAILESVKMLLLSYTSGGWGGVAMTGAGIGIGGAVDGTKGALAGGYLGQAAGAVTGLICDGCWGGFFEPGYAADKGTPLAKAGAVAGAGATKTGTINNQRVISPYSSIEGTSIGSADMGGAAAGISEIRNGDIIEGWEHAGKVIEKTEGNVIGATATYKTEKGILTITPQGIGFTENR